MSERRIEELVEKVSSEFNGILRANLYEVGLSSEELLRLKKRKRELRTALKNCGIGDDYAKEYIKTCIRDILTKKLEIQPQNIYEYIKFASLTGLSAREKFDILLYAFSKEYQKDGLSQLFLKYQLPFTENEEHGICITSEQIEEIYEEENVYLSYVDQLEILVQRVYARYKGLGVIDELRDQNIDGISGGVSGSEGMRNSIWLFFKGRTIHLDFLCFESDAELERVCMNIYRYGFPGQFSMSRGYVVNEMKDHSRVVVVRPPFAESFAFFVRKFTSVEKREIQELITDEGADIPIQVLKYLVKGCQVIGITGAQGSGKTTLLMSLIAFIHPSYTLRIQEMAFELHLRDLYPNRNILTFRETDTVKGQDALDLQKKTDGTVNILGEVASAPVSSWLVQMSMVGSLFTMFTHHAKTTRTLVNYLRNSLLSDGAFSNETIALEQVVEAINFDVHMEKDYEGHRYIERITQIVPCYELGLEESSALYHTVDIVRYENGEYKLLNTIQGNADKEIRRHLSQLEQEGYDAFFRV